MWIKVIQTSLELKEVSSDYIHTMFERNMSIDIQRQAKVNLCLCFNDHESTTYFPWMQKWSNQKRIRIFWLKPLYRFLMIIQELWEKVDKTGSALRWPCKWNMVYISGGLKPFAIYYSVILIVLLLFILLTQIQKKPNLNKQTKEMSWHTHLKTQQNANNRNNGPVHQTTTISICSWIVSWLYFIIFGHLISLSKPEYWKADWWTTLKYAKVG